MALPVIHINTEDTKSEFEALKQLAAAVVANAFDDYMRFMTHKHYLAQVREIRVVMDDWAISEGEQKEALLWRMLDMMQVSFFRRLKTMRNKIIRHGLTDESLPEFREMLDTIIAQEARFEETRVQRELYRLDRFFHGKLFDLYTGGIVKLESALARCHEEIEKERERIR